MSADRGRTLAKYVVPSILSQVSFFLFSIVDGVFVGNGVGTDALGAVNILFPFLMITGAASTMLITGGVSMAAIELGKGEKEEANRIFQHSFYAVLLLAFALTALGCLWTRPIGYLLGANESYIDYVCDYTFCYSLFFVPNLLAMELQFFARNDGAPTLVMISTVGGTALNIFLDWLFVFPLHMGLRGAAIATGISQTVSMLIVLPHFLLRRGDMYFKRFRFDRAVLGEMLRRGFPEAVSQLTVPVATIATNYVLLRQIGEIAVNAYSVLGYGASFSVSVFCGVAEGAQPLFGLSYGSRNEDDLRYFLRMGQKICLFGSAAVTVLLIAVRVPLCRLFGLDGETLAYTVRCLPLYCLGFLFEAQVVVLSAYFYSTHRTREALILNLCRAFVLTAPVIVLLPLLFGADAVWFTFMVYEAMALLLAVFLRRRNEKNGIVFTD